MRWRHIISDIVWRFFRQQKPQKRGPSLAELEMRYARAKRHHRPRRHLVDEMCRLRIEGLRREGYGR
jgi:hypothetical protein